MKLVRFDAGNGPRPGVLADERVVDLTALGLPYGSIEELIAGGPPALNAVAARIAGVTGQYARADVRLLAPITSPGKYLAIGMNYQKHVAEAEGLGVPAPKKQFWFNKQTSCINGPFADIDPGVTEQLDYEVELGVVIGVRAKHVSEADALDHVFGYVVANDVSARDWQFHSPTFTIGKSFDTHGPIGPWIVTADEIPDPQALNLRCFVNGDLRQQGNTADMIHPIAAQIAYLSTAFSLEPGDLIATGTPEGVGIGMNPPRFLNPGDIIRCEVDGIGAIENRVGKADQL